MSGSDGEASKTDPEMELYPGTDTVVEGRVESRKMTENGAEQNASNGDSHGVEVSKLTSALVSFQIASRPFTEWFNVVTIQESGDTAFHRLEGKRMTATDAAPQECGNTASGVGVSIITSSMKTRLASQRSLVNTRFLFFLFFNGSAENFQKSPPDWGRLEYAIFPTNILTRHVYCPCVELTQSVLVLAQFWKHQLVSSLTISRSTLHASAVEMTLEAKVELSTRMEKDEVYTAVSFVTLRASAIEATIEAGFESFLGNNHVRDFMPQSGGLRFSSASCRSPVDSTQRRCPVDSAERLWLTMSESDSEASKTDPELELYPDTDTVVEGRVESRKVTKNGAAQNASNGDTHEVEVSKLTSAFMSFQIASRPFTE